MEDAKLIELAREKYALGSSDDIEIDDNAQISRTDSGAWVQAWVWIDYRNYSGE